MRRDSIVPPLLRCLLLLTSTLPGCPAPEAARPLDTALPPDEGLPPTAACDPALSVTPATATVAPRDLLQLQASGGTGAWQFTLDRDSSGAALNPESGAYVAGAAAGTDLIRLTDAGCTGEFFVTVTVPGPLQVSPRRATLPPGTALDIQWSGGAGAAGCRLAQDLSGAALDGCRYTAGAAAGRVTDTVRVEDAETGEQIDVWITVDPDAVFALPGQGRTLLPVGATWTPAATAGSGSVTVEILDGPFSVTDGGADGSADGSTTVTADAAGDGIARVRDRYAGLQADVPLSALAPMGPVLGRDGERSMEGVAIPLGDVDGDGYADAALGFIEPAVLHDYGGIVAIYAGGPDGLEAAPARVFAGGAPLETMGRAVASADLDGDGLAELIIGADRTDYGGTNTGAVHIYRGEQGRFFSETPWRSLYGQVQYERLGSALAVCDFDGDGWMDLAAGAIDGEDDAVAVPATEQGGVHVFHGTGGPEGFDDKASFILYGVAPDGAGGWAPQPGMHLGQRLTAGDFDGDGRCDLAAGAPEGGPDGADGADGSGLVLLWRGTAEDGLILTRAPVAAIVPEDDGEKLGWRLAAGDLEGDGQAELAVSASYHDGLEVDAGEVRVWAGLDLSGAQPIIGADTALWQIQGGRHHRLCRDGCGVRRSGRGRGGRAADRRLPGRSQRQPQRRLCLRLHPGAGAGGRRGLRAGGGG